jgi:predicted nucleic acid-binding protein
MPFVIDASVALAWSFPDEQDSYATHVLGLLWGDTAVSSPIWALEVANALMVAERRGRIDGALRIAVSARLAGIAPQLQDVGIAEALGPVADLARFHGLSAYDASYLYVAMREGVPLASLDAQLRDAAARAGVPLIS